MYDVDVNDIRCWESRRTINLFQFALTVIYSIFISEKVVLSLSVSRRHFLSAASNTLKSLNPSPAEGASFKAFEEVPAPEAVDGEEPAPHRPYQEVSVPCVTDDEAVKYFTWWDAIYFTFWIWYLFFYVLVAVAKPITISTYFVLVVLVALRLRVSLSYYIVLVLLKLITATSPRLHQHHTRVLVKINFSGPRSAPTVACRLCTTATSRRKRWTPFLLSRRRTKARRWLRSQITIKKINIVYK